MTETPEDPFPHYRRRLLAGAGQDPEELSRILDVLAPDNLLWEDGRWHPWCEACGAWLAEGNPEEAEALVLLFEHEAEIHD